MSAKYRINYRQYDDICGCEYQTKWLVLTVFKFIKLKFKYELVDLSYRK